MNETWDRMLRSVFPYQLLARVRMAQLYLSGDTNYYERSERRVLFYRALCLLWKNHISGDYVEFGCHGGMTFTLAYHHSQQFQRPGTTRKLWAFDSFEGLPPQSGPKDAHPAWRQGWLKTSQEAFIDICTRSGIPRSAYEVVPGFYKDTIGKDAGNPPKQLPHDIAFAYIDCDLYTSTQSVLEFLAPRQKHGMIIALDDYYCYSDEAAAGERVALLEFLRNQDQYLLVPYVQYGYHGMSFIVEDRRFNSPDRALLMSH